MSADPLSPQPLRLLAPQHVGDAHQNNNGVDVENADTSPVHTLRLSKPTDPKPAPFDVQAHALRIAAALHGI